MPGPRPKIDPLLTPRETAALFHVDPRTVTRWAREGKMPSTRTLGGHRRYREADVMALLHPETAAANPLTAGVDSLWSHQTAAILRLRLKLNARGILTLGQLTDRSAAPAGRRGILAGAGPRDQAGAVRQGSGAVGGRAGQEGGLTPSRPAT